MTGNHTHDLNSEPNRPENYADELDGYHEAAEDTRWPPGGGVGGAHGRVSAGRSGLRRSTVAVDRPARWTCFVDVSTGWTSRSLRVGSLVLSVGHIQAQCAVSRAHTGRTSVAGDVPDTGRRRSSTARRRT